MYRKPAVICVLAVGIHSNFNTLFSFVCALKWAIARLCATPSSEMGSVQSGNLRSKSMSTRLVYRDRAVMCLPAVGIGCKSNTLFSFVCALKWAIARLCAMPSSEMGSVQSGNLRSKLMSTRLMHTVNHNFRAVMCQPAVGIGCKSNTLFSFVGAFEWAIARPGAMSSSNFTNV